MTYVSLSFNQFPNDKLVSALADSLIKTMYYVNATFDSGNKNGIFENVNPNKDTTSWYKSAFTDLFSTDQEFTEKFPKTISTLPSPSRSPASIVNHLPLLVSEIV